MVKYPTGSVMPLRAAQRQGEKALLKKASFSDRGMTLEQQINESNQYYLDAGIAVVHKKPTPIQIVKVDYPKRSRAVIREAYFRQASTTDTTASIKATTLILKPRRRATKLLFL